MDIWQDNHPLRFGDIDPSDRLTLAAAFDYFQEAAISHAESLRVGREALARLGQCWVLFRISVVFDRRPRWGYTYTVRSWPRGSDRLFAIRDYDIRDMSDKPLVRARAHWLTLDLKTRRPLRPEAVVESLPLNDGLDALPDGAGELPVRKRLSKAAERRALYSDIDYNGHVNNTRYIQWLQDVTEPKILERAFRMRLDVNYLTETKPGEITQLWTAAIKGEPDQPMAALAYEGRRNLGSKAVFRAELRTWNKAE
jgi:acyl-ACP thioesterase